MPTVGPGVNAWEAIVTDHCRSIHGGLKYTGDYLYYFVPCINLLKLPRFPDATFIGRPTVERGCMEGDCLLGT